MPYFKVNYKIESDKDHRHWGLGVCLDRDSALAYFNNVGATKYGLGRFTFDDDNRPTTDYNMIESEPQSGPGELHALYKV